MNFKQQTLVLIKPDAMERNLAGEILARIQRTGLVMVDCQMTRVDGQLAAAHYPTEDEWLDKVGHNTLNDCQKYGIDPIEIARTKDPKEVGKMIHRFNREFLMSGPVLAVIFEGNHAVEIVRKLVGHTIPVLSAAGTIRGDFSTESTMSANLEKRAVCNLIHASSSPEEAKREIKLWFGRRP